jgi:hypothetical protein
MSSETIVNCLVIFLVLTCMFNVKSLRSVRCRKLLITFSFEAAFLAVFVHNFKSVLFWNLIWGCWVALYYDQKGAYEALKEEVN